MKALKQWRFRWSKENRNFSRVVPLAGGFLQTLVMGNEELATLGLIDKMCGFWIRGFKVEVPLDEIYSS